MGKKRFMLLWSFIFWVFLNPAAAQTNAEKFRILQNLLNTPDAVLKDSSVYPGSPIDLKDSNDVKKCLEKFTTVMKKHGIKERKGIRLFTGFQYITTSEDFSGPQLLDWLCKTVIAHDKSKDISQVGIDYTVQISFAVYTTEMLTKLTSAKFPDDPTKRDKMFSDRKGRITAFLLIYKKNKSKREVRKGEDELIGAYDLGEIHPPNN